MNRHELLRLQQIRDYPCVTITLPTHPSLPENKEDQIRLRNLIRQAKERLLREFEKREVAPLISRLEVWGGTIDFASFSEGLALFVSRDFDQAITLPYTLPERVVVDETFLTRDLVFAMNRAQRYWVLALSEKPTRLFEGCREALLESMTGGFPLMHEGPGGEQSLPGGFGIRKSAYRDEYMRQFFRKVDSALRPLAMDNQMPLAVAGVDRYLAFFGEVTQHRELIIATLPGSYDKASAHELGRLIWPPVRAALEDQRRQSLLELEKAAGENLLVSAIAEIWRMAKEGRGRLLFVEKDFHYPGRTDETGMLLTPAADATAPGVIDDAVNEIIEFVVSRGGKVVFVGQGELQADPPIQLIVRY
jgi:hypothetical protein